MVEAAQKFPDPLDSVPAEVTSTQEDLLEQQDAGAKKRFLKNVLFFLILLPFLTAVGIFAYQFYVDFTLRNAAKERPTPQINVEALVTPEMLPEVSTRSAVPSGWKTYIAFEQQYQFAYPGDWFVVQSSNADLRLQQADPQTAKEQSDAVVFRLLQSSQRFTQLQQLESFVKNVDAQASQKTTIKESTPQSLQSDLVALKRVVLAPRSSKQTVEYFVSVDGGVIRVIQEGDASVTQSIVDQVAQSISQLTDQTHSSSSLWKTFKTEMYNLRYPDTIEVTAKEKVSEFHVKGDTEKTSLLKVSVFDTEPPQSATQSATRDFSSPTGPVEFKTYEDEAKRLIGYLGQLSSGEWLEIQLSYDSNIDKRKLLNQVVDTIELEKGPQQP